MLTNDKKSLREVNACTGCMETVLHGPIRNCIRLLLSSYPLVYRFL